MDSKLNISFLWHQHQPYYKTLTAEGKSIYQMPWARLHAVKDYYDLPRMMDDFPKLKQNFNLVPSLLAQLEDYVHRKALDRILELTLIKASVLSEADKENILKSFFLANTKRLIFPHARYHDLWQKKEKKEMFSAQDFIDLQVWYNLCWVGEYWKKQEPFYSLLKKGKFFSEDDKRVLIDGHYRIMGEVIPLYQRLVKDNRIELSVTPYYHPILPLLCDTDIARRAERETVDASFVFKHPEDADIQVRRAVAYFERLFGFKPDGMWPSEGSVSEEAAALIATFGFSWIATDQEILEHSEVDGGEKNILLPHRCPGANSHLHIVFRDHALSDAIGFSYAEMDPEKAAADFMNRAESVRQRILEKNQDPDRFLLNVILDGENCWEFYPDNGEHFLRALYRRLSESRTLRSVTVGEFIQTCAERSRELPRITRLHAGSWINHNFGIWIGTHKEKNTAWQYLKRTRDFLVERSENFQDSEKLKNAWEEIYIAEGSDWFWWFGDDHQADNKIEFDALFRYHLIRVYDMMEVMPPSYLMAPIMSPKSSGVFARVPTAPIKPKIDGRVTHFYEWADAGLYEAHLDGDTMHLSERWIKNIYYGYDEESLYFRIDFFEKAGKKFKNDLAYSLRFDFTEPVEASLQFTSQGSLKADTAGSKSRFDALMEVQIPFQTLSMSAFQSVELTVAVFERSREIVRRPSRRSLVVSIPDESSDKYFWSV